MSKPSTEEKIQHLLRYRVRYREHYEEEIKRENVSKADLVQVPQFIIEVEKFIVGAILTGIAYDLFKKGFGYLWGKIDKSHDDDTYIPKLENDDRLKKWWQYTKEALEGEINPKVEKYIQEEIMVHTQMTGMFELMGITLEAKESNDKEKEREKVEKIMEKITKKAQAYEMNHQLTKEEQNELINFANEILSEVKND